MKYGSVIKYYRLKQGMTQSELAQDICSVSHLSKIENDSYEINKETLTILLERLNIDLNTENKKIKDIKTKLYQFIDSLHYVDEEQISKGHKDLELISNYCMSTELINTYNLCMLKFYIYSWEFIKAEETKKLLEKLNPNFTEYEKLIYTTACSSLLIKQNSPKEALKLLENFSFEYETNHGEYYYQLGLCHSILNNTEKAIDFCKRANLCFQEECNFIKILYTQMTLAINYVKIELLERAQTTYTRILRNFKMLGNQELYFQNLYNYALLFKQKKEYKTALETFQYCALSFNNDSENYLLCMLNIIELSIELKYENDIILSAIEEVILCSKDKKYKTYGLLAKKFKYELLYPNKRYYKFLEDTLLPHLLSNDKLSIAEEITLILAKHYENKNVSKSNYFYKNYFTIREEIKI